jgi:hypothetical protein
MSLARISAGNAVLDEPKSTVIGTRHIKHYALSIEKSLMKKLNSAKRKQISYKFTGGGLTAELDAITLRSLLIKFAALLPLTNIEHLVVYRFIV